MLVANVVALCYELSIFLPKWPARFPDPRPLSCPLPHPPMPLCGYLLYFLFDLMPHPPRLSAGTTCTSCLTLCLAVI